MPQEWKSKSPLLGEVEAYQADPSPDRYTEIASVPPVDLKMATLTQEDREVCCNRLVVETNLLLEVTLPPPRPEPVKCHRRPLKFLFS